MAICREGKVEQILPTRARQVFDVSGAGDTVIAILTTALASGATPEHAAILANLAAGVVVSRIGTATATLEDLFGPDMG
jgi:D-beta-D-heptose 7-phosphate kinase/D-beta-D-heptose 1-phosphate adenosyltransferase